MKPDQPADFAGTINRFALGDTIDLGVLTVTSAIYDRNGDLFLIGNGGGMVFTAHANSGVLGGNAGGTFALAGTGGIAGDVIVTESGGDTVLTTTPPRTLPVGERGIGFGRNRSRLDADRGSAERIWQPGTRRYRDQRRRNDPVR